MKALLTSIAAVALFSHAGQCANLLLNPSFESGNVLPAAILGSGSTFLTNWTVTGSSCGGNCVYVLDEVYTENLDIGLVTFLPAGGDQSVDITGSGNTVDGGIEQTVNLTPLSTYSLSFYVGNGDNRSNFFPNAARIEVFVNSNSLGIFSNNDSTNNATNWKQFSVSFTPTVTSNTIRFRSATPIGDNLAGLDEVSLEEVPEPGTWVLLCTALVAAGVRRFRGGVSRGRAL